MDKPCHCFFWGIFHNDNGTSPSVISKVSMKYKFNVKRSKALPYFSTAHQQ